MAAGGRRLVVSGGMLASRLLGAGHVAWRFLANVLSLPAYAARDAGLLGGAWRGFVADVINLEKEYQGGVRRVDWSGLQRLVGGPDPALRLKFGGGYGNVSFQEGAALAYLAAALKPRRVFEIGTFDGFSTYHLAMNAPGDAEVFTLNLPAPEEGGGDLERGSLTDYFGDNLTHRELKRRGVGSVYKACPAAGKVRQLLGDSLAFDFSPYRGSVDLCFIDGGHSLECVAKDTDSALGMLSERGVLVWHDFNVQHKDIYRFLMGFARGRKVWWLADTRLALHGPGLSGDAA